jgi:chromosomal replication initiator protein
MKVKIENTERSEDMLQTWLEVRGGLQKKYGDSVFNNWIKHMEFVNENNGEVVLSTPSRFIKEWISSNYITNIGSLFYQKDKNIKSVSLIVKQNTHKKSMPMINADDQRVASGVDVTGQNVNIIDICEDDHSSSPLDRRFTFDNFVIGKSNELAFSAAKSVAMNQDIISGNNPLYLYGGVGHGKTHLMHSIAWHIRNNEPSRKVVYLSAEKFMYQFVRALRDKNIMAFKEKFRSVDVLMVDDVQFICGKESTQEEFFHTVNYLLDRNKQIIISGDRSPSELDGMKERVRSRLGWGLVIDINKTDYDLRLGILKSKIAQMNHIDMPEEVLEFLADKISSNTRELEGALNKVVAHSTLVGNKITLDATKNILCDLLRSNEMVITIAQIQKKVADYYSIKVSDLTSARRTRCVARPRQVAMYLCKYLTSRSLAEIGRKFGGKDHTTVIHAVKRIEKLMIDDKEFESEVNAISRNINGV